MNAPALYLLTYLTSTLLFVASPGTARPYLLPAAVTSLPAPNQVHPNPVVSTGQLTYAVPKAGAVTVDLLDGRGNTLRTVAQVSKQEKGPHTLAIGVAGLPAGTYYFKVTMAAGAQIYRFVKE